MNDFEDISKTSKNLNFLILEKSSVINNSKELVHNEYVRKIDTFELEERDKSSLKNILIPDKISFDINNPNLKLCWKPENLNIDPHLETNKNMTRESNIENYCEDNYSSSEAAERYKALPCSILEQSDYSTLSTPSELKNCIYSCGTSPKIEEKTHQDAIHLFESNKDDENKVLRKRKPENEVFDSSMMEECAAVRKNIMFNQEKKSDYGQRYLEFLLKSRDSSQDTRFKKFSQGPESRVLASDREERTRDEDRKSIKGGDIFGNNFTSKDRNKFKVCCPHCAKNVSAPGYVRHLTYCMNVGVRKRTRRS